jgi:hypothetical protein
MEENNTFKANLLDKEVISNSLFTLGLFLVVSFFLPFSIKNYVNRGPNYYVGLIVTGIFLVIFIGFLIDTLKALTTKAIINSQGLQINSIFNKYSKIPDTINMYQSGILFPWSGIESIIYKSVFVQHSGGKGTYKIGWCKRIYITFNKNEIMLTDLKNANELLKQSALYISQDKIINETLDKKLNFKRNLSDYLRDAAALIVIIGIICFIWYLGKHK